MQTNVSDGAVAILLAEGTVPFTKVPRPGRLRPWADHPLLGREEEMADALGAVRGVVQSSRGNRNVPLFFLFVGENCRRHCGNVGIAAAISKGRREGWKTFRGGSNPARSVPPAVGNHPIRPAGDLTISLAIWGFRLTVLRKGP